MIPAFLFFRRLLLIAPVVAAAVAASGLPIRAAEPTGADAAANAPRICVNLVGGGRVVGQPVRDVEVQAEFGRWKIPWEKVQRVLPGLNSQPLRLKRILADVAQLSDVKFDVRERAQRDLKADGSRVRLILEEFKDDNDFERRTRIQALLADAGGGDASGPAWVRPDVVVTAEQRYEGKLDPAIELKTRFGPQVIPVAEIESAAPPWDPAPVDLLKKIDLTRDVVSGDWKWDATTLVSPLQNRSRVQIPLAPPPNYDLRLTVVPKVAKKRGDVTAADSLFVTIVVAGQQCNVAINCFGDVEGGPFSGMDAVDGRRAHQVPLHTGAALELNKEAAITIAVRGSSVEVTVNGKQLFQWKGDAGKLSVFESWRMKDPRFLGLGSHRTEFHISRCELVPFDEPKRPAEIAVGEALVRLSDGSVIAAKIDEGQMVAIKVGAAERQLAVDSLATVRPEPDNKGFRLTPTVGESFVVEKLPPQVINMTTRFGKLAVPLDRVMTLERREKSGGRRPPARCEVRR